MAEAAGRQCKKRPDRGGKQTGGGDGGLHRVPGGVSTVDDVTTEWLHSYGVPLLILRQVGVERRRDETDERASRLGDINPTAIALDDADFG
jgi:hypothetical protein